MANSPDIRIADEIETAINAESFALNFTAERLYVADWDVMKELDKLQVGVWPGESSAAIWERGLLQKSYRIGLSFCQKISAVPRCRVDELCDLVTEVQDFLELTVVDLGAGLKYVNQGWEYLLRFDDDKLDRNKGADQIIKYTGLFASIVVFDFVSLE